MDDRPLRQAFLLLRIWVAHRRLRLWAVVALAIGCYLLYPPVGQAAGLRLDDEHTRQSLITAVQGQLAYLSRQDATKQHRFAGKTWSAAELIESLRLFLRLVSEISPPDQLATALRHHFDFYPATPASPRHPAGEIFLTGYYEPVFAASRTATSYFGVPIYRRPDSLVEGRIAGKRRLGRYSATGDFIPYWTRSEIEGSAHLNGFELAYLHDPVDAFFLHIQGSGRIQFVDGTSRAVGYSATNGHPYTSIGKVLVDRGNLTRAEVNAPAIRRYLADHPQEVEEILHHNDRFVFFEWQDERGPRGSLEVPLTPFRSIAIDQEALPVGMPAYLESRRPVFGPDDQIISWRPISLFVLPQDSGAAIRGAGRVDLFCGRGDEAEALAGYLQEEGRLFFLVKKALPNKQHLSKEQGDATTNYQSDQ